MSDIVAGYWWLIIGWSSAAASGGSAAGSARRQGTLKWDTLRAEGAALRPARRCCVAVARFSRTLATLLASGVPLLHGAGHRAQRARATRVLEKVVEEAIGSIREGESIAEPLKRSGAFPPIVTHMIAVGEKSGQLEQMLENVADAYEAEVETRVQALTSLLEPLMIVVMGGAVGFIAFSILMPLIQMNQLVE